MSDSSSPNSTVQHGDVQADRHSDKDQLLSLSDRLQVLLKQLDTNGYSAAIAEELSGELLKIRQQIGSFECGLQFAKDLSVANQLITSQADHRSVGVLKYCLQKFTDYLADVAERGVDYPVALVTAFNELFALQKKPLLSENLISIPDECRIDVNALQQFDNNKAATAAPDDYLGFSQTMLGIYRGESRQSKLDDLAQSLATLAATSSNEKAKKFWLLCRAFAATAEIPKGELSPALFKVFKELEGVLLFALGDSKNPVLGMQQNVDQLLANMLCYVPEEALPESFDNQIDQFSGIQKELGRLFNESPGQPSMWMRTSIHVLAERLQYCAAIFSEEALESDESVSNLLAEIVLLKRLLLVVGVHGARENLDEVENSLRSAVTQKSMQSSFTSLQLVEQQMLYQFNFLQPAAEMVDASVSVVEKVEPSVRPVVEKSEVEVSGDFATRCNLCIDVIQQSLDTALGSSGNLIPDSTVVSALNKLIELVSSKGIHELTGLLTPLSRLLTEAEDSTLNQSETLLVQEAIIAATLGIDSLVGLKPMPDMIINVTDRVEEVLQSSTQRFSRKSAANGARSGFLVEAGELLPRLFELFQRLRGAPNVGSRLYGDINRLLHAFKVSADDAQEHQLAELAHALEATMLDLTQSNGAASQQFFDVAIESIECLDEDIERLRNSEQAGDRSDLIDRLKLAGAIDPPGLGREYRQTALPQKADPVAEQSAEQATPSGVEKHITGVADEPVSLEDPAAQADSGAVLINDADVSSHRIDWVDRFRRIEACYSAIDHSHRQLLDLQRRAEQLVNTTSGDQSEPIADSGKALQSLTEQLQQIAEHQHTAVKRLDTQLGSASMVQVASMRDLLLKTVDTAAMKKHIKVQFAFEGGGVELHTQTCQQIGSAVSVLLDSLVTHAIPENNPDGLSTVSVRVQQNERAIMVDVVDDGSGVVVQGPVPRSSNPWLNVARPDWREVGNSASVPPQAWSKQSDKVVNINGLLRAATLSGGTVAISSDDNFTCYRLSLPLAERLWTVLVFEAHGTLLALPAAKVESVGVAEDNAVTSLGQMMGLAPQSPLSRVPDQQIISVKSTSGVLQFSVERVVGSKTLKFSAAERILPDVPGYIGVSVADSEQLVMLVDIDYWSAQQ